MWLRAEQVDGVHVGVGLATIFDALDGCRAALLAGERLQTGQQVGLVRLTSNIAIEDVVCLDGIVHNLLGVFVHYQAFPLRLRPSASVSRPVGRGWTGASGLVRRPA